MTQDASDTQRLTGNTPTRILVIHTDEQHHTHLGCRHGGGVETPHLDALAERGTHFVRAYGAAGVCVPSRAALMTGRSPVGNGTVCNENTLPLCEPTMGSLFGSAGVATGYFGKAHYGRDGQDAQAEGWHAYFSRAEYNAYLRERGLNAPWPEGKRIDAFDVRYWTIGRSRIPMEHYFEPVITDQAISFMQSNRDRPFLCFASLMAPHSPFTPPGGYATMYDPASMPLMPRVADELACKSPQAQRWVQQNQKYFTDEELRIWAAANAGLMKMVDDCVGRLLEALCQLGIRDNTLIIFVSDHGGYATRHGIIGKSWMQSDDLLRIPLIVDDPNAIRRGERLALVQNTDLLPTLLDYAGLPTPSKVHGRSILPLLRGETAEWDRPAFAYDHFEYSGGYVSSSMIVDGPWKYVHQHDGWREVYHMDEDPDERRNLANDARGRSVMASLMERLLDWHVDCAGNAFDADTAQFWEDETLFYDEARFNGERQFHRGEGA